MRVKKAQPYLDRWLLLLLLLLVLIRHSNTPGWLLLLLLCVFNLLLLLLLLLLCCLACWHWLGRFRSCLQRHPAATDTGQTNNTKCPKQ
jgi:protein-S-isoprenylcysteine O-methyltransferase Ste14